MSTESKIKKRKQIRGLKEKYEGEKAIQDTDEKRSTGFGKKIDSVATKDVAENERENEHHDLKEDADSGGLLVLDRTTFGLRRRDEHNLSFVLHAHGWIFRCCNDRLLKFLAGSVIGLLFLLKMTPSRQQRELKSRSSKIYTSAFYLTHLN